MAFHIAKGKQGEAYARNFLDKKGLQVLTWNWRSGHHEIDIIATENNVIHFIEVKTRSTLTYGYPEESVSRKKFLNLKLAAVAFLVRYPHRGRIQFDILSILLLKNTCAQFYLIEDVYI
jgi:putative endonuclease